MQGDNAASSDGNGKVTLAILSTKLDILIASVNDLAQQVKKDHDCITALNTQMDDLQYIKRVVAGVVVGLVLSLGLALYSITQHVVAAIP